MVHGYQQPPAAPSFFFTTVISPRAHFPRLLYRFYSWAFLPGTGLFQQIASPWGLPITWPSHPRAAPPSGYFYPMDSSHSLCTDTDMHSGQNPLLLPPNSALLSSQVSLPRHGVSGLLNPIFVSASQKPDTEELETWQQAPGFDLALQQLARYKILIKTSLIRKQSPLEQAGASSTVGTNVALPDQAE